MLYKETDVIVKYLEPSVCVCVCVCVFLTKQNTLIFQNYGYNSRILGALKFTYFDGGIQIFLFHLLKILVYFSKGGH